MATGSKVQLSLDACGVFHVPGITKESAAKASELLQENHDRHHIFFNADGFHSTSSFVYLHAKLHPHHCKVLCFRVKDLSSQPFLLAHTSTWEACEGVFV